MHLMIQNPRTGRYLTADRTWASNPGEGRKFQDTLAASEYCRRYNLEGVHLILRSNDDERLLSIYSSEENKEPGLRR